MLKRFTKSAFALALLAMPVCGAYAEDATAQAETVVVQALDIVKTRDLEFGSMLSGGTAGRMVVNPNTDARTATGGVTASGTAGHAARFMTYGGPLQTLYVYRGPLPTLNHATSSASMDVSQLTLNGPVVRYLNSAGLLDLRVGGRLEVPANQEPGEYEGEFTIYVFYF